MPNTFFRHRINTTLTLLITTFLSVLLSNAQASETVAKTDLKTDPILQLHIDLVETALLTDAYNTRCRGISISKYLQDVNRLYVTKYSLTAHNFIKRYVHEDVRTLKSDRLQKFNQQLMQVGGCQTSESHDWSVQLNAEFKAEYQRVEKSVWFPY